MNTIKIGGKVYQLPTDEETLRVVLNHLDMVLNGVKTHIKLTDLEGETHSLTKTFLQNVEIGKVKFGN